MDTDITESQIEDAIEQGLRAAGIYSSEEIKAKVERAMNPIKGYYRFPPERDVVFVLGAGATYGVGVPLQSELVGLILDEDKFPEFYENTYTKNAIEFIRSYFFIDIQQKQFPSLESVFGLLEYCCSRSEGLAPYSNKELNIIKDSLIKIIHIVIARHELLAQDYVNSEKFVPFRKFWELVETKNTNVSIVSLNYDTNFEVAFDSIYGSNYLDYRIHFMNYEESLLSKTHPFFWWVEPSEELIQWGDRPLSVIKVIKPHGSLNWSYCSSCGQVYLRAFQTEEPSYDLEQCIGAANIAIKECPFDGSKFSTLIVPPSHYKNLNNPVISRLFNESIQELRFAKKIVFIGYSFPEADIHIKAILEKSMIRNKEIFVVNPTNNKEVLSRTYPIMCRRLMSVQPSLKKAS